MRTVSTTQDGRKVVSQELTRAILELVFTEVEYQKPPRSHCETKQRHSDVSLPGLALNSNRAHPNLCMYSLDNGVFAGRPRSLIIGAATHTDGRSGLNLGIQGPTDNHIARDAMPAFRENKI
jgi:hypothetical protein